MDISTIFQLMTPITILIVGVTYLYSQRISKVSKEYENYKNDEFRKSIEQQVYALQKELYINRERFNDVNHLVNEVKYSNENYFSNYNDKRKLGPNSFLNELGISSETNVDATKVFVLTPFNSEFDYQYDIIRATVSDFGFKCVRGDDSKLSSSILSHIVSEIANSKIIIANLSGRNPNVFYELGIAHALGKPVLLMSETLDGLPFDIQNQRILTFNSEKDLSINLKRWFAATIVKGA
ncbi:hypothetical protein [Aliivibrio sifiae]|uniref:Nucleoside 2-deoxyribosyltransferase n=1 Tax=Aliivibrio sifiae TaxID=566293 RepID=A0A2S7X7Y1_9GAMM|nr:hypothetical protein [Aliivibrio sifiae]PQJ87473.1 hypothetical protein BTO23_15300 [Aliivibrio sifiae]GLR77196.1 hypothetical protein GCM10007855_40710 [Aliivibrio sifiae]